MVTPPQVVQWVKHTYPKPTVDPEWLDGCYSWIESELKLNPTKDIDTILYNIDSQLLHSDLSDSMLAGTGLPPNVSELDNFTFTGPPILVEVVAMTEIGHSAFSLHNVRQARIERADLAGLAKQEEDGEEEGSIPNYPRSMLKFELSDGSTNMQAIEYKRLPDLRLGESPLGFKMMLKNVLVRRGIAFLEPSTVIVKGCETEDRQKMQDADFVRNLHRRLHPDEPLEEANDQPVSHPAQPQPPIQIPQPPPNRHTPPPRVSAQTRSPLQQIARPEPTFPGSSHSLHEDEDLPRRRKVPVRRSSSPEATSRTVVPSRYFPSTSGKGKEREVQLARELRLSPHRHGPVVVPDSDEEASPPRKAPVFRGRDAPSLVIHPDRDDIASGGGNPGGGHSPNSSEFEFEFDVNNEEFLSQLDKVEKEAFAATSSTLVGATQVLTRERSSSSHLSSSTSATVPTVTSSRSRASHHPEQRHQTLRSDPAVHLGTIVIDDDEESDEKENFPVPTRRVRQRTISRQVTVDPEDIIEISD